MSGIGGIFSREPRTDLAPQLDRLIGGMSHRGGDRRAVDVGSHHALGVGRFAWEESPSLAGHTGISEWQSVCVVADASIYYRDELRRALAQRRVACESNEPSDLVLAAYRAWGVECAKYLDGDFAFIVVDADQNRVLLARDYVGRRSLHFHASPSLLVVASTARAVASQPLVQAPVNLTTVAAAIGGLLGGSRFTGFEAVHPVAAGTALEWTPASGLRTVWSWRPPAFRIGGKSDVRAGAEELRGLIMKSVAERVDGGVTAMWLSGGADSTAIFGAGSEALRQGMAPASHLHPVTVSYPEGDTAREDLHVTAIASRWATSVEWINSEEVDLFLDLEARAEVRDDPYAHTFEMMNRKLAQTSVGLGARVAFDGYGGDQLFHVSEAYLADLFGRLRWRELTTSLQAHGFHGWRAFLRWGMAPWLPESLFDGIQRLRKREAAAPWGMNLPPWLAPQWRTDAGLRHRLESEPRRRLLESPSRFESRWYVETPYFPRAVSWAGAIATESGVEVRSPLLDRRIIEFAASRPLSERAWRGETKLTLREAVRTLIPDSVLAHRPTKTGIPRGYLHRQMRSGFPKALEHVFAGGRSRLEEAGLASGERLRESARDYSRNHAHVLGVQLLLTLQCELWLRSVSGW